MIKNIISNLLQVITAFYTKRLTIKSDGITYRFYNLSYKKIINACLTEASIYFKPLKSWGMPTNAMIEPSTFCNLKCTLCPVTTGLQRPTGNIDIDMFSKVIKEIGDYIFTLLLWDWGEPFMNPRIYDMISLAKQYNIKVISSTNGHMFEDIDKVDRLIRSGLDTIIFAIDGIHQDTYETYRQGGKLQTVLNAIKTVVARKSDLGSRTPFIVFRFIVMGHNEHEIPELKELAKSLGVDALALKTLNAASQDPYFKAGLSKREDYDLFLPKNIKYRRFKNSIKDLNSLRLKKNPCRILWNCPTIHWNGTVNPCTYDPKDKYALGNLKKNSFREIWNSSAYRKMRREFRMNWESIGLCNECSYAYKGGDCSREAISEVFFYGEKGLQ